MAVSVFSVVDVWIGWNFVRDPGMRDPERPCHKHNHCPTNPANLQHTLLTANSCRGKGSTRQEDESPSPQALSALTTPLNISTWALSCEKRFFGGRRSVMVENVGESGCSGAWRTTLYNPISSVSG
eukprot:1143588-Pelagomonas_calceolata.AAC.4